MIGIIIDQECRFEQPGEPAMQAQPVGKDGSVIPLDELEGVSAAWGFSTGDLLEERRQERELARRREA